MSFNVLIAEDDPAMRVVLKNYLSEIPVVEVIGEADDGINALKLYEELKPSMILLDIDMPGMSGLEVAEEIIENVNPYAIIVFCTGSADYKDKAKAMELLAFDYITKPFDRKVITRMMNRVLHFTGQPVERKVTLKTYEKYIIEDPQSIVFITRVTRKIQIHCMNGVYTSNKTLSAIEDELKNSNVKNIARTHKGFLVNLSKVKEIIPCGRNSYQILMESTDEKPIMTWEHRKEIEKKYPAIRLYK